MAEQDISYERAMEYQRRDFKEGGLNKIEIDLYCLSRGDYYSSRYRQEKDPTLKTRFLRKALNSTNYI